MYKQQHTPVFPHTVIQVLTGALQATGQPVHLRAIGFRLGRGLEISIYCGDIRLSTVSHPSTGAALEELVAVGRIFRAAEIRVRTTLYVHPASLPF